MAEWSRWDKDKRAPWRQGQKSAMETRFVGLYKRWMVVSKLGTVSGTDDSRLEPRGKRVIDGRVFGKVRPSHSKN